MLLDAWSLQALAAAGTAIAGECGRCAPPSHAVPSAHMSTNASHATAFSAQTWVPKGVEVMLLLHSSAGELFRLQALTRARSEPWFCTRHEGWGRPAADAARVPGTRRN